MRRTLVRYKTKPEAADRNAELVTAVFAELKAAQPQGLRYLALRLEDDSFVHIVENADDGPSLLPTLKAFQEFQAGIRERCLEPPMPRSAAVVGNYRMLEQDPDPAGRVAQGVDRLSGKDMLQATNKA